MVPEARDLFVRAVDEGGGRLVGPADADGLIWTDPHDPEGLALALRGSPARWVQLPFAGIDNFIEAGAVDPARAWTCAKGLYGPATAEHALALILAAARRIHVHARADRWTFVRTGGGHRRLRGTTALIVGTGGIGANLARMLAPLEPQIVAVNRSGRPLAEAHRTETTAALGSLVPEADWIVLACPLTPETRRLFGAEMLARMKPDAWLFNVARGPLVDTGALVETLRARAIGGAALDVTDPEPLPAGHPLWTFDNCVVTPHVANTVDMAVPELAGLIARNVRRFAAGEPLEGPVDPALGY